MEVGDEARVEHLVHYVEDVAELAGGVLVVLLLPGNLVDDLRVMVSCHNLLALGLVIATAEGKLLVDGAVDLVQSLRVDRSHYDLVTLTILLLEVSRRAIADELSIDHNGDFITKRFSLVHSVGGQQNR